MLFIGLSVVLIIKSFFNISLISLFVCWFYDILIDKYNGILIGYWVGWIWYSYIDVGFEVDCLNIINLKKYWLYEVYVVGRINGGVGVKYSR